MQMLVYSYYKDYLIWDIGKYHHLPATATTTDSTLIQNTPKMGNTIIRNITPGHRRENIRYYEHQYVNNKKKTLSFLPFEFPRKTDETR